MKRRTIKKALAKYDRSKGYGRTLIKEEPHIKELRSFYEDLKEDDLSSSSLLKLASILIGKKTRTDTTESGIAFGGLVKRLGGYDALDTLKAANQLTEGNVVFLEKHIEEAKVLAPLIVSIFKNTGILSARNIFNAAEQIKNPQELIPVFKELELISQTELSFSFMDTLYLLNKHNLYSDEVLFLLKTTEDIINVNRVLERLVRKNPALITMPNLSSVLKIKHYLAFNNLLINLPSDQNSLNSLFQANDTLSQCPWAPDILGNFKKTGWGLQPYLDVILSGKINDLALKLATTKLMELKLKSERIPLILHAIFTHSNESIELIAAVETLNSKEGLDEQFLKVAFGSPKFANQVATALVTLQNAQCYHETSQLYVCMSPEYALGLAQFWIQFSQAACSNLIPRATILKHPQCAAYAADVVEFLRKNKLHNARNIIAICDAKLTSEALLNTLKIMNEAKILDQTSFDLLVPELPFIKTLCSGLACLANSGKLDSFNFDTLLSDPINAVALAENLGGKSHPKEDALLKNPGAQDFVTIRKNTKILCQGHRQGLFFPEMSPEQKLSFEKISHKTPAEVQKEILMKIVVQYTDSQELEEETKHNIFQDIYSSFCSV